MVSESQFKRTLPRFPCTDEIVRDVELYMVTHITKKINVDIIVLIDWMLEQYYPNSKQLP